MSLPPRRERARLLAALLVLIGLLACGSADPLAEVRRLHARGDFAGSLESLRELVAGRPEDAEVQYLYGLALVRTQQPSLAVWSLRKAMEDPKWLSPAALVLAGAALATGNHEEAIGVLDRVIEAQPENVDALVRRAEARLGARRNYEGALEDTERALAQDPDRLDALVARTVALLLLERSDEADAALADLEARVPEADLGLDVGAKFCLARATFTRERQGREAADPAFQRCLRDYPADPKVLTETLAHYDALEKPERAIEILREALAADPQVSGYRALLSARLEQAGQGEEAVALLREGTEDTDPERASVVWVDLANLYTARSDYIAAADALAKATSLTRSPRAELMFQYAETLVMAGRAAQAREIAARLGVPAHRELIEARALLSEDRPEQALTHFDAALRLWPDNAVARYFAAIAAERTGDFDRAIAEYRYSMRAGTSATNARYRLARLHEAEHADALALTVATHETVADPPDPEAERVALRIFARQGQLDEARRVVARHADEPERWGRALAALTEGVRERHGAAEAAKFVRAAERVDLTDPRSADALRELVIAEGEAGNPVGALAAVDAALAAHPDESAFHTLRGDALARKGGAAAEARAAYERAQQLDPKNARALAGLARLAAERGDAAAAIDFYGRAVAADREELGDPEPLRALAELLLAQGRRDEAEARLAELLRLHPYDGAAAAQLSALRLERDPADASAQALARRAQRFGRAPEKPSS